MPLINGMKMACEPCIRGHRSTKCTHANERLMVPVRKPGRPLSQCPHPGGQNCMCGSVTAAIPKKQSCHCGGDGPMPVPVVQLIPRASTIQGQSDVTSPTKATFKVQKATRPSTSRRQSFDPVNFERIDMNSVNVIAAGMGIPEGFTAPSAPQAFGFVAQYATIPQQLPLTQMQPPPVPQESSFPRAMSQSFITSTTNSQSSCCAPKNAITTPQPNANSATTSGSNGASHVNGVNGNSKASTNGGSCCGTRQNGHVHDVSTNGNDSAASEQSSSNCCSSKKSQFKQEPISNGATPIHMSPAISQQMLPQAGAPFSPVLYQQFQPPATYTYPPTYGSFQNPLNPSAWRQGMQHINHQSSQSTVQLPPTSLPYDASFMNFDTVHTCGCGDGCQCIGCAAHPYNDTTQAYVRSAWEALRHQGEGHSKTHTPHSSNGNTPMQTQSVDPVSSPTAHTPSSTISGNGEEQNLSESDYLFVNYPFLAEDGCGGDTTSCPCGDDCQCIGCAIHNAPTNECSGQKDTCPCEGDCKCVGCILHQDILGR